MSAVFTVRGNVVRMFGARGYYRGTGIYVHLPKAVPFTPSLAAQFLEIADGQFHMDVAPDLGTGVEENADVIVTRGLDYDAFKRGENKGYFKFGDLDFIEVTICLIKLFTSEESTTTAV